MTNRKYLGIKLTSKQIKLVILIQYCNKQWHAIVARCHFLMNCLQTWNKRKCFNSQNLQVRKYSRMNECLTTPQHEKQIGYWVSEKGKYSRCHVDKCQFLRVNKDIWYMMKFVVIKQNLIHIKISKNNNTDWILRLTRIYDIKKTFSIRWKVCGY